MKSEIVKKSTQVVHFLVAASSLLPLPLTAQQINRTVLPVPDVAANAAIYLLGADGIAARGKVLDLRAEG